MSSDGPGDTQGVANWLHWNPPSHAQTRASETWVVGEQKLKALHHKHPSAR
jgi:hypothetical protein